MQKGDLPGRLHCQGGHCGGAVSGGDREGPLDQCLDLFGQEGLSVEVPIAQHKAHAFNCLFLRLFTLHIDQEGKKQVCCLFSLGVYFAADRNLPLCYGAGVQ